MISSIMVSIERARCRLRLTAASVCIGAVACSGGETAAMLDSLDSSTDPNAGMEGRPLWDDVFQGLPFDSLEYARSPENCFDDCEPHLRLTLRRSGLHEFRQPGVQAVSRIDDPYFGSYLAARVMAFVERAALVRRHSEVGHVTGGDVLQYRLTLWSPDGSTTVLGGAVLQDGPTEMWVLTAALEGLITFDIWDLEESDEGR